MRGLVVVACLLAAACGSGAARAQPAASPAVERSFAAMDAWLQRLLLWQGEYEKLLIAQADLLGRLNEGVATAVQHVETGDQAAGAAWGRAWAVERRAEVMALKQRLGQLSRTPPSSIVDGVDVTRDPSMKARYDRIRQTPDGVARQLMAGDELALSVIDAAERSAAGDETAYIPLTTAAYDLNIGVLQAELQRSQAQLDAGAVANHPQESILVATVALDRAYIEAFRLMKQSTLGEGWNRAASAAAIRKEAAVLADSSGQLGRQLARARQTVRSAGGGGTRLAQKVETMLSVYEETMATLTDLASMLRALADSVEAGPTADALAVAAQIEAGTAMVEKFVEQDQRRRTILAGT